MTNREQFIYEIENLLKEDNEILSEDALAYFEELKNGKASLGGVTETGVRIINWLKSNTTKAQSYFSAKLIGEGLFTSSRAVSGAARKLISDGYLVKEGKNPVTYALTEKGLSFLPEDTIVEN